ncbi:MAG: ribosomal protein S18-alanine N-acetyltransferase [Oscillospiraceae bacterium]|nr:ribosomal protein S18-alanine N-acetyltransferase [Oscillospiraceae bacterium]
MEIVNMTKELIPQIAQIEAQSIPQPWSESDFEFELTNKFAINLVCVENQQVIGFLCAHNVYGQCNINSIATHPDHRNEGIATKLLSELINRVKDLSDAQITLEVRLQNKPAISFYEKQGFVVQGTRANFYKNPTDDALLYTLKI